MQHGLETYLVRGKKEESFGITTLILTDINGQVPFFLSGQYITVFFTDSRTSEGKAYSISSAPHEKFFDITIRAIGEFSNRLSALQVGDAFTGSKPYGFFGPETSETDLVMLASGIGITPFRSLIRAAQHSNPHRQMYLFHSIRTHDDALFVNEFKAIATTSSFVYNHFVTREEGEPYGMYSGRIHAERVLTKLPVGREFEFLLCGSISFTRDMWRDLKKQGISEDRIYTEAFFTHS